MSSSVVECLGRMRSAVASSPFFAAVPELAALPKSSVEPLRTTFHAFTVVSRINFGDFKRRFRDRIIFESNEHLHFLEPGPVTRMARSN